METKKTKKADLSHRKSVYFNLGLVLAMAFIISAFEWKSYGEIVVDLPDDIGDVFTVIIDVPITKQDIPKPPKPKPIKEVNPIFVEADNPDLEELKDLIDPPKVVIDYDDVIEIPIEKVKEPDVFVIVETMPEFEGGYAAFMKYLSKKIKYPNQARRMGIEGKVFVEFIIDENGQLTEVHTIKGIGAGCDEEAERVLKNAQKWSPGKQRGVPVKVKMVLPIEFRLGR